MQHIINDGGRAAAGYKGLTGDCCVRSFAIASGKPYQEVYDIVNELSSKERTGKRKKNISNARTGVYRRTAHKLAYELDNRVLWTPTMFIGSGCKVHLADGELPNGRLVVSLSKHFTAVIDGIIHDTHDPQREPSEWIEYGPGDARRTIIMGGRCVYGYWTFG